MAGRSETYLRRMARVIALSFSGLLAGCDYHGNSASDLDNPAVQKFAWFSFLDGNDLREACAALGPNAPARYRLSPLARLFVDCARKAAEPLAKDPLARA